MNDSPLSPRKRVEAVLCHQPVDRVPTFVLSISCQVASELLGRPALTGTGELHFHEAAAWMRGEQAHREFEQQVEADVLAIHRHLDLDAYHPPWRLNRRPTRQLDEFTFVFGDPEANHEVWRYSPVSGDFGCTNFNSPVGDPIEDLREQVDSLENSFSTAQAVAAQWARSLDEKQLELGDAFALAPSGGCISVGNDANSLMALVLAPDLMARKVMALARRGIATGQALAATQGVRVLFGGGDLASRTGPMYSPKCFGEIVLPAYREMVHVFNTLGLHYAFRSDGNIWPLADMLFLDACCPGFGEVDRDAGMTVGGLRNRYPQLVIWGNVPSGLLATGTVDQVRDEVKQIMHESCGQGYIHGCSNAIVMGTPPANVEAMFSIRN